MGYVLSEMTVGKNEKLERFKFPTSAKLSNFGRNFPSSLESFQLRSVLSNFAWSFPTSLGSFQLEQKLSNIRLSNLKLSNHVSRTAVYCDQKPHSGRYVDPSISERSTDLYNSERSVPPYIGRIHTLLRERVKFSNLEKLL